MDSLLGVSHELLQLILAELEAEDLARLRQCCRSLRHFIGHNTLLWKSVYLRNYDTPRLPSGAPEPSWEDELKKLVKARKVLESSDRDFKRAHFADTADVVLQLVRNIPPGANVSPGAQTSPNLDLLAGLFETQDNADNFLRGSSLWTRAGTNAQEAYTTRSQQQLSAKLHCYYGLPDESGTVCSIHGSPVDEDDEVDGEFGHYRPTSQPHPFARAQVYDLRNYTDNTMWGPFRDDGSQRVDWEKMEAIMVVLAYNLKIFRRGGRNQALNPRWDTAFAGASPDSFVNRFDLPARQASKPSTVKELPPVDEPYGITGTWMRIVCFLDYTDLYAYNFVGRLPADQPRDPLYTEEATRLIMLELKATAIQDPGDDDGKDLPVVTFTGSSRSIHAFRDPNANSKIRGVVRQTPEGEIRWTTFSIFHGDEERWRSEGIQVGGLRSARGILGNWFDKDYDPHGPAGPTAFWKLTDELTGVTNDFDSY